MAASAAFITKLKRRFGAQNIYRWSNPGVTTYSTEDTDVIDEAFEDVKAEIFKTLAGTVYDETIEQHIPLAVDATAHYMKARATERGIHESDWNMLDRRAKALRRVTNANRLRPTKVLANPLHGRNKTAKYSDDQKLDRLGINGKNSTPSGTSTGERF